MEDSIKEFIRSFYLGKGFYEVKFYISHEIGVIKYSLEHKDMKYEDGNIYNDMIFEYPKHLTVRTIHHPEKKSFKYKLIRAIKRDKSRLSVDLFKELIRFCKDKKFYELKVSSIQNENLYDMLIIEFEFKQDENAISNTLKLEL